MQLKDTECAQDFLSIEGEVRDEFFAIGNQIKEALNVLFQPDKMNYAALSNTSSVLHVHLVPRYQDERRFASIIFKDERWGQNYAPYNRLFALSESVLFQIRDALAKQLAE